jgi:hypothetical protein
MGFHIATHPPIRRLSCNLGDVIAEESADEIADSQRDNKCADADDEAYPTTAKEFAQPVSQDFRAVTEEFVNGFPELG